MFLCTACRYFTIHSSDFLLGAFFIPFIFSSSEVLIFIDLRVLAWLHIRVDVGVCETVAFLLYLELLSCRVNCEWIVDCATQLIIYRPPPSASSSSTAASAGMLMTFHNSLRRPDDVEIKRALTPHKKIIQRLTSRIMRMEKFFIW